MKEDETALRHEAEDAIAWQEEIGGNSRADRLGKGVLALLDELDALRHANASLIPGAMLTATEIACLRVERDARAIDLKHAYAESEALREENARLRPVVEAADGWMDPNGCWDDRKLIDAIYGYRKGLAAGGREG